MKKHTLLPMSRPGLAPVGLHYATVTGRAERWFFLNMPGLQQARAQRAESCLIEPECGDTVLVCGAAQGGDAVTALTPPYILAVLIRADSAQASLTLPGNVKLHSADGTLRVDAERFDVQASHSVNLEAPRVALSGLEGEMRFQRFDASIQQIQARLGSVATAAQQVTSTIVRLVQRTRDSFRWTDNLDETRAGRVRVQAQERFQVNAKHASMLVEGHVKIDGSKIDLG